MKNRGTRGRILKEIKIEAEEIEKIQKELKEKGYAGKLIDYQELQELYKQYGKGMGEAHFAQKVLGLSYGNYMSMKNRGTRGRILYKSKKIQIIQEMFLQEKRYYTKREIEGICTQNSVTIDEFITQILSRKYTEEYKRVIQNGKIWIGKIEMSNEFVNCYYVKLKELAQGAINQAKIKYGVDFNRDEEDQMQNAILYVSQNRGDIEKNFQKGEIIEKLLYLSIEKYIQYNLLNGMKLSSRIVSLHKRYIMKSGSESEKEFQEILRSDSNTEEEAIRETEESQKKSRNKNVKGSIGTEESVDLIEKQRIAEKCIEELKKQIEKGANREQALENTAKKLEIGKKEMIEAMQTYLITKGKVEVRKNNILNHGLTID